MSEVGLCKNCSSEIKEYYCPHCGQEVKDMNLSILSFIKEFIGNLFSLDSKVLVTFKHLIIKPGFLSNEYISGRRKQYTLPSRLYLFVTIISLIIISLFSQSTTHYLKFYGNNLGFIMAENVDGSGIKNYFGKNDYKGDIWNEIDAQPISVNILSFISKVFFLLVPVFALLLKCFYWKRLYVNHLILVLHNHSFMVIWLTLIFMINKIFSSFFLELINPVSIIIILLSISSYIYISAYKFYKVGKIITLIKFVPLAIFYFFTFGISNILIARLFFSFPNVFN